MARGGDHAYRLRFLPTVLAQLGIAAVQVAGYALLITPVAVSTVRLWSGNTGLPALFHIAADIAGV